MISSEWREGKEYKVVSAKDKAEKSTEVADATALTCQPSIPLSGSSRLQLQPEVFRNPHNY